MLRGMCRAGAAIGMAVTSVVPALAQSPAPAPAKTAPLGGRLGLNVHGGLGIHSAGGVIDDSCALINQAYEFQGFTSSDCGGDAGGTPLTLGAFLSFNPSAAGRARLQIHGGYSFTGPDDIQLETNATYPDFGADFSLVGGYRFNSHAFYAGAGVEVDKFYIGGKLGLLHHTGDEYVSLRLLLGGVPYQDVDDERPKSGTSALVGVRVMYAVAPGFRLFADWETYGLGDYYETFQDTELPAAIQQSVRNRVLSFGVAVDIFSFIK